MTKQTKRKGKTKMKNYQVNDVVQFLGDEYKVVEVLQMEDAVHIKKTSAPGNSMVVPVEKLENNPNATTIRAMRDADEIITNESARFSSPEELFDALNSPTQGEADVEINQVLEDLGKKFDPLEGYDEVAVPDYDVAKENQPDLLYHPDDRVSL